MKRKILIISGILVLVLLLGGAAYIGGRLLNGQGLPGFSSGGKNFQLAAELPQTPADVDGVFESRQDNSILVGTGKVTVIEQKDQSGPHVSTEHDGPTVEIVVTTQTTIYEDVTQRVFDSASSQAVQQVVEPGSLDEIGPGSMLTVWGRKTGDRYIADVLVYSLPDFPPN
jgi:hypothetical protein